MNELSAGFTEIEHTADWALIVWAPNLGHLFALAAEGMYWLMEVTLQSEPIVERVIELESADTESLLVAFLSELLYLSEMEGIGFNRFEVSVVKNRVTAAVRGAAMASQKKEIKAVTYHNLNIENTAGTYSVTIVFDV